MKMKPLIRNLIPVLLLALCSISLHAQPAKNQSTVVVLKTANTLLQARQYEPALEYFKKALQQAKKSKNIYQQAQAWEGLATLYSQTKQSTEALVAFQTAIKLYKGIGYNMIADLLNTQMRQFLGVGDLYAGIEIGAKGIKLTVIDVKPGSQISDFTLRMDTSINTDAAALSYQSEKETLDAITLLYEIIQDRFEVPDKRIYIVISSGLKQELDKYNKADYFAGIIRPKQLDPKIKISFVTVDEEAAFSFKGIVPQASRLTANQLDIGSANTKGGYQDLSRKFIPVTFPIGTRSFQKLLENRVTGNSSMFDYRKAAEKLITDSLGRMINYSFRDKAEFKSREQIYLSGGIVWCIASLMHPEKIKDPQIELSLQDILDFQNLASTDFETLANPELSKTMTTEDAAASRANIKRVLNTYDQKSLLAGSVWLGELIRQLNSSNPNRKLLFPRYAYVGWISGYIMDKISRQYTDVAAN